MPTIVRYLMFASETLAEAYVSDDAFMAGLLLAFGLVAILASLGILTYAGR